MVGFNLTVEAEHLPVSPRRLAACQKLLRRSGAVLLVRVGTNGAVTVDEYAALYVADRMKVSQETQARLA